MTFGSSPTWLISQVMWFVELEVCQLFAAYSLLFLLFWLPIFYNLCFLFVHYSQCLAVCFPQLFQHCRLVQRILDAWEEMTKFSKSLSSLCCHWFISMCDCTMKLILISIMPSVCCCLSVCFCCWLIVVSLPNLQGWRRKAKGKHGSPDKNCKHCGSKPEKGLAHSQINDLIKGLLCRNMSKEPQSLWTDDAWDYNHLYFHRAARRLQRTLGEFCGWDSERDQQEKHSGFGEESIYTHFIALDGWIILDKIFK